MMERLQKLLAQAGIASRRHAEEMILAGRVRVNGKVVSELGTQVDPELDKVLVDNQPVELEPKAYFILNKPRGYISDRDDTSNLKTALDLVPDGRRLFAAGRLDLMSEGMLFLTNDGELANRLTHPRYEHEKEYLVLVFGTPDDKTIARLEKGIIYDGEWMRADVAERAGRNQEVGEAGREETWLRIILHEGKKRQIRHMCAALGHAVKRLVRVRMGGLKLGNLKVGEWRKLSKDEVALLTKTTERRPKLKPRTSSVQAQKSDSEGQAQKQYAAPRRDVPPRRDVQSKDKNFAPRREDSFRGDAAPRRDRPTGKDFGPRRDGAPAGKSFAPRRDGPSRRDSAPRREGPANKSFVPRREGPPRRDDGPRREPPPTRTSFSPGRGGSPRTGGGGAPRREGPAGKGFTPRREGPPRRDEGSRREPQSRTSFSPGRGGSPRTGGGSAPRRDGPPARTSSAPRREGPPRRDDGPRRSPPTRTSFSPGRGGSPRTGGGGGAPRREGPPRENRKGNDRERGGSSNFNPPQGHKRNAPPSRGPKRDAPSSHKPKDKRRDD